MRKFIFTLLAVGFIKTSNGQPLNGHWVTNVFYTYQCLTGVAMGSNSEPFGCPTNPTYTAAQTNTFIFDNLTNDFAVDFNGFSSGIPGCPRLQIKINGIFYPLSASNLIELPTGNTCTGSVTFLTITPDGYITRNASGDDHSSGQGRLLFYGVNANSITISSNDAALSIYTTPFIPVLVPIKLVSFSGQQVSACKALLKWETGTEINVKNIEVIQKVGGGEFKKVADLTPTGSNSSYLLEIDNNVDSYFKLRINDFDGHYEFSDIIFIKSKCKRLEYGIFPNPAKNSIEISKTNSNDRIVILDMLGRIMVSYEPSYNSNTFNIQQLIPGMYFLQIVNGSVIKSTIKFVKN